MTPFRHLLSLCSLIYGLLNLTLWCVPLFLLTLVRLLVPPARPLLAPATDAIYRAAVRVNDIWFRHVLGYRWSYALADLDPASTCLVIANHQSWTDSFVIQSAIVQRGPILKVLVKEELMRFPVLALIFWAYDFPRLQRRAHRSDDESRRRRQDTGRIRAASEQLQTTPGALLVYPEGTRFTPEKHATDTGGFRHLLRPRPGGFATMVTALKPGAADIIDLTLFYPDTPGFWRFLSGDSAEPELAVARFSLTEVGDDPASWLKGRWLAKDAWLCERRASCSPSHPPSTAAESRTRRG